MKARHVFATKRIPKEFGKYAENNSSKIVACIRTSASTGLACIRAEIPKNVFPACVGFVPGCTVEVFLLTVRFFYLWWGSCK